MLLSPRQSDVIVSRVVSACRWLVIRCARHCSCPGNVHCLDTANGTCCGTQGQGNNECWGLT